VQRFRGRSSRDVDRHAIVARHTSALGANERAAIDTTRIVDDADVIDAVFEHDAHRLRRG